MIPEVWVKSPWIRNRPTPLYGGRKIGLRLERREIALARFAAGALSFPEKERSELVENLE